MSTLHTVAEAVIDKYKKSTIFLLNPNSFMEYAKLMKIKAIAMISLWLFEAASQTQK